jgi:hypothetical protein
MRADGIDLAVAAALKAAGCATVWIGAESGSQRVLDAMEKGTRVEQIDRAATLLREAGIEVCFFLQFGFPGETLAEIELTLDMVRRNRPDDIGISVSYPLPGTPFYERVRAQLGDKQNWVDSSDLDMMPRRPSLRLLQDASRVRTQFRAGAQLPALRARDGFAPRHVSSSPSWVPASFRFRGSRCCPPSARTGKDGGVSQPDAGPPSDPEPPGGSVANGQRH